MNILDTIIKSKQKKNKLFAVLIDPDRTTTQQAKTLAEEASLAGVDYLFIGSSLLANGNLDDCLQALRDYSAIPLILFPGSTLQISKKADAILFLSLISGRNPEMLIGKHVTAAPLLKHSNLEIIPSGYMLIDAGHPTSVSYMSNTLPIPHDKNDIASCTALAGEMLGMKLIFMDAGSGARTPVSRSMITEVSRQVSIPLIVGGGIKTAQQATDSCEAGADVIVVGNSIEKNQRLIYEIAEAVHLVSKKQLQ